MSSLEALYVAILLLELGGTFRGLGASFGEVSSILAIPSIIEPWLCTGAIDGSGCTNCTVVPCQLLF